MYKFRLLGASAIVAASLAFSAQAQATTQNQTAPTMSSTNAVAKAPTGDLRKVHGQWRSSTLVGADVYNHDGQTIGTIDNLLVTSNGQVSHAIISVGGFLGVGSKLVEVPFDRLQFKLSKNDDGTTGANDQSAKTRPDYSVVLAGATKASLKKMVPFTYHKS
jgi:sporulation protein YlmC with PRC-barrel domain